MYNSFDLCLPMTPTQWIDVLLYSVLIIIWALNSWGLMPYFVTRRMSDPQKVEGLTKETHKALLTRLDLDARLQSLENRITAAFQGALSGVLQAIITDSEAMEARWDAKLERSREDMLASLKGWWGVQVREGSKAIEALRAETEEAAVEASGIDPRAVIAGKVLKNKPELGEWLQILQLMQGVSGGNGGGCSTPGHVPQVKQW